FPSQRNIPVSPRVIPANAGISLPFGEKWGSLDSRHKCNTCYGVGAMGTLYEQLSLRERVDIDIGRRKGLSMQAIGQMLGRSASTISRELGRNGRLTRHWRGSYDGERADGLAA